MCAMTELTYQLNRGYWHWTCLRCGARGRERIPDQAYAERDVLTGQWCREEIRRVDDGEGGHREAKVLVPVAPARWDHQVDGYQHNPGNPALVVCPSCNGKHPFRFLISAPIPSTHGGAQEDDGHRRSQPLTVYELLEGPWLSYGRIARYFSGKASPEDREDLAQDILVALAEVASERGVLSSGEMLKTARYAWLAYLRDKGKRGGRGRHPAPHLVSLNQPIDRDDQSGRELWETLADRTAQDLDAWLDAEAQLRAYPPRAISLADKKARGERLTAPEQCCLSRIRARGGPPQPTPDTGLPRFADIIAEMVEQGWGSYHIWRELQALGYGGSRSAVKYYLAGDRARKWRRESNRRRKQALKSAVLSALRTPLPDAESLPKGPRTEAVPSVSRLV